MSRSYLHLKFFFLIPFLASLNTSAQNIADLSSGKWHKLKITSNGVYKIDRNLFTAMGFDANSINPRYIRVFGNGGGMLPQPIAMPRPLLTETSILVQGESDGKFDDGDYILFYAEGADSYGFDAKRSIFRYEKNLYSDENYYFITVSDTPGARLTTAENITGSYPVISEFNDFAYHELDEHNELSSGREWFGEKFGTVSDVSLTFQLSNIVAGSDLKIVSDVMLQSYAPATFNLFLNGIHLADQSLGSIPAGSYSIKGHERRDTFLINDDLISAAGRNEQEAKYHFTKTAGFSQGYLDFILVNCRRALRLYGNQTIFTSEQSLENTVSTFSISAVSANTSIWNITDIYNPQVQKFETTGSNLNFSAVSSTLNNYIIFNDNIPAPALAGNVTNQNLRGLPAANLIIITHSDFESEAQRLAQHRRIHSNWSAHVVTVEQIYNEFSSGRQDITALRDFIKVIYDQDPQQLKAVLFFGRGSYDFKMRVANNTNFVPIYQSRSSLNPLETYASDDYFVFLEDHEGNWGERPSVQHHTLDAGVGRIPVSTAGQAQNIVDKIIKYETQQRSHGYWRKKISFVADDGNGVDEFDTLHQYHADVLANMIEDEPNGLDTKKIFMGTYKKTVRPNGETVEPMAEDIERAFDDGAVIINYTGHGSEKVWADERVLTEASIDELTNEFFPFLVTATCEFGRNDDPFQTSSAERSLTKKDAGSIGLVTTTRPVNAFSNFGLNIAFYNALLAKENGFYNHIGEVFRQTKNNSTSGVSNRNFTLLGDPSMHLALPPYSVNVTSIAAEDGSDTLKALSKVTVTGHIEDVNGIVSGYEGTVEALLFDKKEAFETTGRNDPSFKFEAWKNILFRGNASVKEGEFKLEFVVPKNISYAIAEGKLSLYASSESFPHAAGFNDDFKIGGTDAAPPADTAPPEIKLFIGDTTFTNGGYTTSDTYLVAHLKDNSGINISGYGVGNGLIAILDDEDQTFILNDYYVADMDTYKSGRIKFPLRNISPGEHHITMKVWDVYNNTSDASITFYVTDGRVIVVNEFAAYPNPIANNATIFFSHNLTGEDLETTLSIYTPGGILLGKHETVFENASTKVDLIEIDNVDKNLAPGIYFARLVVRSLSNGSKMERLTKLIILN
ncbi:MAG TPA: type IX secretion system sortase PorU [Chryseosolibacter sp.]|nr:type IX secretion system sortase PorU [Chryseosolibacter sp.]